MLIRQAVYIFAFILLQCLAGDGSASIDGSFPLNNGTITHITDYNRMDQCMAEPGYYHVHHNSFVFFLEKHQFCGGGPKGTEGLLLCYKGQLDKMENMFRGLMPNRQFELLNVPGNAVAKRCADAGHPGWHGMLIYTDDKGQWVIKFSTSNQTFVITGKRLELLVLKLASAKDGGESFLSKIFGPKRDFMDWSRRDGFGAAEEVTNRIRIGMNEQLKKLFMELVKHQALLRNYMGIWSLGLDMLPTDENINHLDLYVQKSECCKDIQPFFNLPSAQSPEPKREQLEQFNDEGEPIVIEANFVENFNGTLDGVVKENTNKNLSFELVDLFHPDGKDQGMRLIVNFENNSIIFERMENKIWKTNDTRRGFKYHFGAGVAFHLSFIMNKNGLIVNMNCYGPVQLNATAGGIDFKNVHRIKIDGEFQLTKPFVVRSIQLDNNWMITKDNQVFGISAENSGGIVLRGKIDDENAKKFSIKLYTQEADGFFETILELTVDILGPSIKYSNGSKNVLEDAAFEDGKPRYDAGGLSFEVLVQFKEETFDMWMNNSKIGQEYNTTAGFGVVNYVQILGDATGNLIQLPKVPMDCALEMSKSEQNTLSIIGKMLAGSKSLNIELKSKSGGISTPLLLTADFTGETTKVTLLEKDSTDKRKSFKISENGKMMKIGHDFDLKIRYSNETASEIVVAINGEEEIFKTFDGSNFVPTTQYSITAEGDMMVLEQLPSCVPTAPLTKPKLND